jgi:DNA-binding NarL/FixJ family response regulator
MSPESAEAQSPARIRILLADDHDILRDGLRALFEAVDDIEIAGEARTGREAVEQAERLTPDVILMDISMPERDGVEACRRIRTQQPHCSVLFLTMHEAEEYLLRSIRAGASGYVIKRTAAADLLAAVRAVAQGEMFLSPGVAHALAGGRNGRSGNGASGRSHNGAVDDRYAMLTGREREILQLVGEGYSNQEIADLLILSVKTVQSHRAAVMQKLDLRDVTHLVRYAVRKGIVDPEL